MLNTGKPVFTSLLPFRGKHTFTLSISLAIPSVQKSAAADAITVLGLKKRVLNRFSKKSFLPRSQSPRTEPKGACTMSRRNRPLSKRQLRTMKELLKEVEATRLQAANSTAGKRSEGEHSGIRTEDV